MDPAKKTAFLLTEIAMDLLSNKFYDVDGNQVKDMESLHKYKCDASDYLSNQRNLRRVLCISDVSFQAADNIQPEIINLDLEDEVEENVSGSIEINPNDSTESTMSYFHDIDPTEFVQTTNNDNDNQIVEDSLINSEIQEDRLKYLIELTKDEFKKIKSESQHRRNDFLLENIIIYDKNPTGHRPIKELSKVFFAREKKMLENECEALISFIKVVKKTEFPSDSKKSNEFLNKISSDIMKTKEIMCGNPKLCN